MLPLKDRLITLFERVDEPRDDAHFEALALEAFAWQYERNVTYAAYCNRRGRSPATVSRWTEIPAVPTAAFREIELVTGAPGDAGAVFRTSGTTRGREARGVHIVPDVALYHASLLPNFRAMVLPDGAQLPMLSLVPAPAELPDSSLAHMIGVIVETLGAPGSAFCASVSNGLDAERLRRAIAGFIEAEQPVCILGTSLSFVHWLDALRVRASDLRLPAGSRLMDTGGFKGAKRAYTAGELRARYVAELGLALTHCVNEYGMTELCSQFYDAALRDSVRGGPVGPARKVVPPGVRSRVVDPETLEPVAAGEVGLLQHIDLANLGSVLAVQTEDLGMQVEDGFVVLGRVPGAVSRGCSIAMDELLQAAAGQRP